MSAVSSMQYTIGIALDRALDSGHLVEILVDGSWLTGAVVASDGVGVVLENEGREHCIARLERISAVRVASEAPMRPRIQRGHTFSDHIVDGAVAMPGPRSASD